MELDFKHLSINSIVKERNCYNGYDRERKARLLTKTRFWLAIPFFFYLFVTDIRALPKLKTIECSVSCTAFRRD